ncbi:MAG: hypothetical protein RJA25_1738 [Bacteroidota bacterium]|jgi:predicted nucleotidyltransferase
MVTRQAAINMAKTFVQECKESGLHLTDAFLFGSVVKNTQHESSDIDVVLVSENFTDNIFENLRLFSKINIKYPLIEVHPYSPESFLEATDFIQEISKYKIALN